MKRTLILVGILGASAVIAVLASGRPDMPTPNTANVGVDVVSLQALRATDPVEQAVVPMTPASRGPTEEEVQHLKEEILRLTRELEDCQNEVENLQFYLQESREEATQYRWAAKGGEQWLKFMDTPLFDELSDKQRDEVHSLFQRIGEPLADWQIREYAAFYPAWRKRWDDVHARMDVVESGISERNGDYWHDPAIVPLRQERKTLLAEEDEKLLQILGQRLFDRYSGPE